MKKKTLLGVAAAAAVGAAGWYLAAGGRKNQIEHIRREAKRLLAVRRDELAALRSAAEEGELDAGALGPVPLDGAALESVRMEDGAAVLSLRGEKAAVQRAAGPAGGVLRALAGERPARRALHRISGLRMVRGLRLPGVGLTCCASGRPSWSRAVTTRTPSPRWWTR